MDTQTAHRLDLVDDAIAANQSPEDAEHLARLLAYKEKIMSEMPLSPAFAGDDETPRYPSDGSGHARQTQTPASDAQLRFISNLLNDRVVPDGSLHAGAITLFNLGTISKRSASELIDWLIKLPVKAEKKNTASEKQVNLIEKLLGQMNDELQGRMQKVYDDIADAGELNGATASQLIDTFIKLVKAQPKPETPAREELESGMYRKDDKIYKVYRAVHGSGKMCAKELVKLDEPTVKRGKEHQYDFEYRGLAERYVSAEDRMTLEEAKEFGAIYGVCCCCGATLTDEKSIEAGIGPICARKF